MEQQWKRIGKPPLRSTTGKPRAVKPSERWVRTHDIQDHYRARVDDEADDVATFIWDVLQQLRVGIGKTLPGANSKALHHLLPDLVPSIDRNYRLNFFLADPSYSAAATPTTSERFFHCSRESPSPDRR